MISKQNMRIDTQISRTIIMIEEFMLSDNLESIPWYICIYVNIY